MSTVGPMDVRAVARRYASQGFSVCPWVPGERPPLGSATRDPDDVLFDWRPWPSGAQLAIAGASSHVLIVELAGDPGRAFAAAHGFGPTRTVRLAGDAATEWRLYREPGFVAGDRRFFGRVPLAPGADLISWAPAPPSRDPSGRRYEFVDLRTFVSPLWVPALARLRAVPPRPRLALADAPREELVVPEDVRP